MTRRNYVHLTVDRIDFDELKELLQRATGFRVKEQRREESVGHRIRRESAERLYEQLRDVEYVDGEVRKKQ